MSLPIHPRSAQRGFTLTELMVAITGGAFVTMVVFMLARDGRRLYIRESRVADATSAVMLGFQRLQYDISRAGFMSTPNIQRDPKFCGTIPADFAELSSIRIGEVPVAERPPVLAAHGPEAALGPDVITLLGNFRSADAFPMWGIDPGAAGGPTVSLQQHIGPLAREGYGSELEVASAPSGSDPDPKKDFLKQYFPVGGILRIVDSAGDFQYAFIAEVRHNYSDDVPEIVLVGAPALVFRGAVGGGGGGTPRCGVRAIDTGTVNPVTTVEYRLVDLSDLGALPPELVAYGPMLNADSAFAEEERTALIRVERAIPGADTFLSAQIVADFAVDLAVEQLTVVLASEENDIQALGRVTARGEIRSPWADRPPAITDDTKGPEFIRSVRVRLGVRSAVPDRAAGMQGLAGGPGAVGPEFYRMNMAGAPSDTPFARVRTLRADVSLPNHEGLLW